MTGCGKTAVRFASTSVSSSSAAYAARVDDETAVEGRAQPPSGRVPGRADGGLAVEDAPSLGASVVPFDLALDPATTLRVCPLAPSAPLPPELTSSLASTVGAPTPAPDTAGRPSARTVTLLVDFSSRQRPLKGMLHDAVRQGLDLPVGGAASRG